MGIEAKTEETEIVKVQCCNCSIEFELTADQKQRVKTQGHPYPCCSFSCSEVFKNSTKRLQMDVMMINEHLKKLNEMIAGANKKKHEFLEMRNITQIEIRKRIESPLIKK